MFGSNVIVFNGNFCVKFKNFHFQFNDIQMFILVIFKGYDNIVEFLIEHGADIQIRATNGQTPCDAAVDKGCIIDTKLHVFESKFVCKFYKYKKI